MCLTIVANSPAWTYPKIHFQTLFTNRMLPSKKLSSIIAQHSVLNCLTNNWRYFTPNFGLHSRNILLEQEFNNEFARKVCICGALNFKPENSSTKVNDHHYKIFLGNPVSAQSEQIHSYGGEAAKFVHCNGFFRCDWIGSYVVTLNQPKLWDKGGK